MEQRKYHVYKSNEKGDVRGHKLTAETLAGDVGRKLREHIEGSDEDNGRVEVDGFWFVWFPAPQEQTNKPW